MKLLVKGSVHGSARIGTMFVLAFLSWQQFGFSQFVIQNTKYIHHVFKRVENSGGYDGHITLDVNGDGVWDMAFHGSTTYNKDYPKFNSGQVNVGNRNPLFKVCRFDASGNVLAPYYYGETCYCLSDTLSWKSKKFDNNNPLIGSVSVGGGPMAWTKLDNAYAYFILESSPGVIDTGWIRFTSRVWTNGFWINVHSIGTNAPGWKPIWHIYKELPKPIKTKYPDKDFTIFNPLEDTIIVEPPPLVDSSLQAYPNPFGDELTINLLGIKDIMRLELIDFNGRMVYQERFFKSEIVTIPTSYLPPGQYVLRVVRYAHPPSLIRVLRINPRE